jgi:hypothetical protein
MSGKGNCCHNFMVKTFFKSIKAELIISGVTAGKHDFRQKARSSSISMGSITRADATNH